MLADMADRVHEHGALAGVQLWSGGYSNYNSLTRKLPVAPHSMPPWHGPGIIAAAVFAGHRYGRELGGNVADVARDRPVIS